ncbi:MAG: polyprenyl synthetase [Roseiflexus castenholzii]|uniref:polyprenyl synthetase family protein n=1 Tax=Roseiflexus castenholzii TaxID=120962 RepID=UPI000CC009E8|nr:MAG: polyprenyl synthetase [Roseiflexus castenholzii]
MKHADERTAIEAAMRAAFPQADERVARFYAMQEYHLGWRDEDLQPASFDPGKLLRPRLCLLSCRVVGGDPRDALPLAAAIQLLHDFSLIHDDIQDQSDTRRGRPTVWKLWGLAQGINTGDGMFTIAHLALHRLSLTGVPPATVLDVLRRFDETILTICEGQFLDLSYEGNLQIDESAYLAMIERKTAALIAASAELGALVGGADEETIQALFDFGRALGMAFQIEDDVLGIWGDPAVTGKPFAADLHRRKLSLPVIHALTTSPDRAFLKSLYAQAALDNDSVRQVLAILDAAGSRVYAETTAAAYHGEAFAALDRVQGDATALEELRAIATSLLGRRA